MTGAEIAECLGMALSTVSAVLGRIGLGKLSRLEPPEPPNRYERCSPRRAGPHRRQEAGPHLSPAGHRVIEPRVDAEEDGVANASASVSPGWEFVHVCVDDATRLAYVEVLADERATTAIAFQGRALGFFQAHGIRVERVMTDNGSAYRSTVHAMACRALGIRQLRTRPYRPAHQQKGYTSSAPCSAPGPTEPSTAPRPNAPQRYPAGSSSITPNTARSTRSCRELASTGAQKPAKVLHLEQSTPARPGALQVLRAVCVETSHPTHRDGRSRFWTATKSRRRSC